MILYIIKSMCHNTMADLQTAYAFAEAILNFRQPPTKGGKLSKVIDQITIPGLAEAMQLMRDTGKSRLDWAIAVTARKEMLLA